MYFTILLNSIPTKIELIKSGATSAALVYLDTHQALVSTAEAAMLVQASIAQSLAKLVGSAETTLAQGLDPTH